MTRKASRRSAMAAQSVSMRLYMDLRECVGVRAHVRAGTSGRGPTFQRRIAPFHNCACRPDNLKWLLLEPVATTRRIWFCKQLVSSLNASRWSLYILSAHATHIVSCGVRRYRLHVDVELVLDIDNISISFNGNFKQNIIVSFLERP